MKSYNDAALLFGLVVLGVFAGFFGRQAERGAQYVFNSGNNINTAAAIMATEQNIVKSAPPDVTLGFVGDIMLDRGVRKKVDSVFGSDYSKLFANADFLKDQEIMFANLEGPVSDKGTDRHNLYSFRMDPKVIPVLKDAGIDVVSFANNHVGDWGRPAFEDTLARLHDAGIQSCGAGMDKTEAQTPAIFSENGYTVGYLCFSDVGPDDMAATDTQSGILLASDPNFDQIVQHASQQVNALIVSFHFGVEYQATHTDRQAELASRAVNDGAVMVVGAHPHVSEDTATYAGAPILYSLGNFIFDQPFSKATQEGTFATATLTGKTVHDLVLHTVKINDNFAPSLAN